MDSTANISDEQAAAQAAPLPRILIADDSRVMRLAIAKILGTDYEIVQAENGQAAWERLTLDAGIQALLTDIQMPLMDGYELICRIRASDDGRIRDLPVMTITGSEDDAIKQQALACGATDFVIKPLDAVQLRARVQAYVRYDQNARVLTEKNQNLEGQAITDPHTGLRSRKYLMQRGEQDIAYAQRHAQDLALLRIDIDGFKKIYRAHGDEVVDRMIAWLAKLLFSTARTEDTVARVSGAEFAVLATNIDMEQAKALCQRIITTVGSQPFSSGSASIPVTLTIGVASLGADRCETIEALYGLAHQRLCHAMSEGGNRICTSIMDDGTAQVEEVTLEGVGLPTEQGLPEVPTSVAEVRSPDPEPETVSSMAIASEPALDPHEATPVIQDRIPSDQWPSELMSVDKALAMIALGKGRALLPYIQILMREIQPLIELHDHLRKSRSD